MAKPKVLFICGSLNQTTMMHSIAEQLDGTEQYFTPYYSDGMLRMLAKMGTLDWTILGGHFRRATEEYLTSHELRLDYEGRLHNYDLVVTCQDLIIPKNIRRSTVVLVQEGMTDPENMIYHLVRWLKIPRYLASTSATGLSHMYDAFCVASKGYRNHFIKKGVDPSTLHVTGIPNFDNCERYRINDFPHQDYVLCATSDSRETFKIENRNKFIRRALEIADGRELLFKLHPNENHERAQREIEKLAPHSPVFIQGNAHEMVANSAVLITRFSTLAYTGLALNKEVHSDFDLQELRLLMPIQNGGTSAHNIATVCRNLLAKSSSSSRQHTKVSRVRELSQQSGVPSVMNRIKTISRNDANSLPHSTLHTP